MAERKKTTEKTKQPEFSDEDRAKARAEARLDALHDLPMGMGVRHRDYLSPAYDGLPKPLARVKQRTYDAILGVEHG